MKTLILCGGKGTRLDPHAEAIPKALVEIGRHAILWHIMKIFEAQGFDEFVTLLGYKGIEIKEHFLFHEGFARADLRLDMASVGMERVQALEGGTTDRFRIVFADTGEETPTGGRIKKAEKYLDGETFMVTYGDGVADIDLKALLAFHRAQGTLGTVTVVQPPSQFGEVVIGEGEKVTAFQEKPRMEKWVNGGFFVFEPGFLKYLGEDDVLERAPLERLAAEGQLSAYRHTGFWQCMDTFKDAAKLNELWQGGKAPWKLWKA
ncbi:MAG: sugar phosphate nucleotidyltransferase [Planctomycetota bacterium]|jgi:glucose-1-phosphate cytidylyltransferase